MTPNKPVVVTGSDTLYFPLVLGCLLSIMDRRPDAFDYLVLDCGLAQADVALVESLGARVVRPDWDLTARNHTFPEHYKALICRAFLPKYCGADRIILWLDADAWVQNPDELDWLVEGAKTYDYCGVQELDCQYSITPPLRRLCNLQNWYDLSVGYERSAQLYLLPVINNGVFAMRGDSPIWKVWQDLFAHSLTRTIDVRRYISDQLTLNAAVYRQGVTLMFLPATFNWCLHLGQVMWSDTCEQWIAPGLPERPIAVMHLSGISDRFTAVNWKRSREGWRSSTLLYRNGDYLAEHGLDETMRVAGSK